MSLVVHFVALIVLLIFFMFSRVKACVEGGCFVNKETYEVYLHTHGCYGGSKAGRIRVKINVRPLFPFYIHGIIK